MFQDVIEQYIFNHGGLLPRLDMIFLLKMQLCGLNPI